MNTDFELELAFVEIFNNTQILKLYDSRESYFWRNRYELYEMLRILKDKDLYLPSEILTKFEIFIRPKLGEEHKHTSPHQAKSQKLSGSQSKNQSTKEIVPENKHAPKSVRSEEVMNIIGTKIQKNRGKGEPTMQMSDKSSTEHGP